MNFENYLRSTHIQRQQYALTRWTPQLLRSFVAIVAESLVRMVNYVAENRLALRCSIADVVVVFALITLIALLSHVDIEFFLSQNRTAIYATVFPPCILAGWYGYRHAIQLLRGHSSWVRPIAQGFILGVAYILLITCIEFMEPAIAAGGFESNFGSWSLRDWGQYGLLFSLTAGISGFVGSFFAAVISLVNRRMIRADAN